MTATVTYSFASIRSEFQANGFGAGDQLLPDVLGLSDGYVRGYTSAGYVSFEFETPGGVHGTFSSNVVGGVSLSQLDNGNVVFAWYDEDSAPRSPGITAEVYSDTGEVVASVAVTHDTSYHDPQVTGLENGGFVVTYELGAGLGIYAQVYSDIEKRLVPEFHVNTTVDLSETDAVTTALADGGFVVVWTDTDEFGSILRARIFNADGTLRTNPFGNTNDFGVAYVGDNTEPAVAALPNGNFAIAYADTGWGDEAGGITLAILDADGNFVNAAVHVNEPTPTENESDPDITVLDNGFIVVSWTYPHAAGDDDTYIRVFNQDGNPVTGEFPLDSSLDDSVHSAVSALEGGEFIAAWQDSDSDGSGGRISASVQELVRTTTGDDASETLTGDELRDVINAGNGNDTLKGGPGADTLNGGGDLDTADYRDKTASVVVALNGGHYVTVTVGGVAEDTIKNIENIYGGSANDTLTGDANANFLYGYSGDDLLKGGLGADELDGYTGVDTADYSDKTAAVVVTLNGSTFVTVTVGGVAEDTMRRVENVTGGSGADKLTGDANANVLQGGNGDDTLKGGAGADTLNGGAGTDIADFRDKTSAVSVTLNGGQFVTVKVGGVAEDTMKSVEGVIGGLGSDTLTGDSLANLLAGRGGGDVLTGMAGADTFLFNTTLDAATNVDHVTDFVSEDTIDIDNIAFAALTTPGTLVATAFYAAAGATSAHDSTDRIVYNTTTGALYYDADGQGGTAAVVFAVLDNHAVLTNADFVVV